MLIDYLDLNVLMKLGIAGLLGMIIGIERELEHKPLGLKTCTVIAVVSCLMTIVSIKAVYTFELHDRIMMDPLRLAAQIVSGIGFLGAGVIMHRSNDVISGLTTAAIIWGAAGLGIASGAGFYAEAIITTVIILVGVEIIPLIVKGIGPKKLREKEVFVTVSVDDAAAMELIVNEIKQMKYKISSTRIRDQQSAIYLELVVLVKNNLPIVDVYRDIKQINGVEQIDLE